MNQIEREVARRAHEREWLKQYGSLVDSQRDDDDRETVRPEFRDQIPLTDGITNRIGMEIDGEIVSYEPRPPKGALLIGAAPWHGTRGGYQNYKCRCVPCTGAQRDAVAEYRRRRAEAA